MVCGLKEDRQQGEVRMQGSRQGRVRNWMVGLGFYAILFYGDLSIENIFVKCSSSLKYKSTLKKERIYRVSWLKGISILFSTILFHFKCNFDEQHILCSLLKLSIKHEPNIQKLNHKKILIYEYKCKKSIKEMLSFVL